MRTTKFSLVMLVAFAACAENPTAVDSDIEAAFAKGGKPAPAPVPAPTFDFPQIGYSVVSDGKGLYVNGVCGVMTAVYTEGSGEDGAGDAILDTQGRVPRSCSTGARKLTFHWADADSETLLARVNVGAKGGTGGILDMVNGETRQMPLNINISTGSRCNHLKFRYMKIDGTTAIGGADATVTRSGNTWTVTASAAECKTASGFEGITLPLSFTITL